MFFMTAIVVYATGLCIFFFIEHRCVDHSNSWIIINSFHTEYILENFRYICIFTLWWRVKMCLSYNGKVNTMATDYQKPGHQQPCYWTRSLVILPAWYQRGKFQDYRKTHKKYFIVLIWLLDYLRTEKLTNILTDKKTVFKILSSNETHLMYGDDIFFYDLTNSLLSLKFVPKGLINNILALVQHMAGVICFFSQW